MLNLSSQRSYRLAQESSSEPHQPPQKGGLEKPNIVVFISPFFRRGTGEAPYLTTKSAELITSLTIAKSIAF